MRRWMKIVLAASLAGNMLGAGALVVYVHHAGLHNTEVKLGLASNPKPNYPLLARERFAGLPGAPVVFVGDSHIQNARLDEIVGHVANRGIGGATIRDVTGWVAQVLYPQTKRLVFEAGTNDEWQGRSAVEERRDYLALIGKVRALRPDVTMVFLSVPPSVGRKAQSARVNAQLRAACEQGHVRLVDLGPMVAPSGVLEKGYTLDGTHLNSAGYNRVAPLLREAAGQVAG